LLLDRLEPGRRRLVRRLQKVVQARFHASPTYAPFDGFARNAVERFYTPEVLRELLEVGKTRAE
jgi:hypothetical protein